MPSCPPPSTPRTLYVFTAHRVADSPFMRTSLEGCVEVSAARIVTPSRCTREWMEEKESPPWEVRESPTRRSEVMAATRSSLKETPSTPSDPPPLVPTHSKYRESHTTLSLTRLANPATKVCSLSALPSPHTFPCTITLLSRSKSLYPCSKSPVLPPRGTVVVGRRSP